MNLLNSSAKKESFSENETEKPVSVSVCRAVIGSGNRRVIGKSISTCHSHAISVACATRLVRFASLRLSLTVKSSLHSDSTGSFIICLVLFCALNLHCFHLLSQCLVQMNAANYLATLLAVLCYLLMCRTFHPQFKLRVTLTVFTSLTFSHQL